MWLDELGVAHTIALPKPKVLMTKSFRGSLGAIVRSDPHAVEAALERAEEQLFATGPIAADPAVEEQFVGLGPPRKILRGSMDDAAGLLAVLERLDHRWRLDAILALQDYID
jgi:hypothetical protein